ncbi:peptidase A2 domain-containing protein [Trichonephila clavipes]|nr:peptidase A2 domain-containing protein [Trichonephila clavipes]
MIVLRLSLERTKPGLGLALRHPRTSVSSARRLFRDTRCSLSKLGWNGAKSTVTCMMLKATTNDRRHLVFGHNEFCELRSDLCRSGHLSKSCPNHSRGPRCLSCNLYGHKSFECRRANFNNTSTPPSGVNVVHKLPSAINMCKDVTIFGRKLNGLVDTGSNLTLLRNSTYINIDAPPLKQTNTLLTGFDFSQINVIGTFDSEITIDDQIFPVTISVVPNSCTNYDLIIGCDVVKQAHLNITPTFVKFAQILRPSDNANENFIMAISDGSPTFDIGPNVSQHNRADVEQLLSTYTPKETKTVNIELDIALTDDEPIFHKPRRLPFAERDIVHAQVDEWFKKGIVEPCSSPYASQDVVVKKKTRNQEFALIIDA